VKVERSHRIPGVELLEYKGDIPIEMDRILTDDDFKRMKKLLRKKKEEAEWGGQAD
jgi:hypothetical protein